MTRLRQLLVVVLALVLGGCCCCSFDFEFDPSWIPEPLRPKQGRRSRKRSSKRSVRRRKVLPLGDARYPAGSNEKLTKHRFYSRRRDALLQLGYGLTAQAEKELIDNFRRYAKSVGYYRLPGGSFRWRPPARCRGSKRCIYDNLTKQSEASVKPITRLFQKYAIRKKFRQSDVAELVVRFVQDISYRIPKEEPFGILAPAAVVARSWGDCDSKALLAHIILQGLGIRSVVMRSKAHRHAMLGVALPAASGHYFEYRGTRYAFVETTAKGAPIGYIKRSLLQPNDWKVIPMQHRVTRIGGKA